MPSWRHFNPVEIVAVGPGALSEISSVVPPSGEILLVTTRGFTERGTVDRLLELLSLERVTVYDGVTPNAELTDLERLKSRYEHSEIGAIVALGGGSTLDTAKVLSATLHASFSGSLTIVLRNDSPCSWSETLPLIAIPTTAGTGAEVTPFATVWDSETNLKFSLAGERLYPRFAILDPTLTLSLPFDETLYSGLDAVSHALESLWNKNRTPVSIAYASQAISIARSALPAVLDKPDCLVSRERMQNASLLAGLAISQTRTALAHSISYPLTSRHGVPHGLACSFTLTEILRLNIARLSDLGLHESVLSELLQVLRKFELGERLTKYVEAEAVLNVQAEMRAKGRFDNFDGDLGDGLVSLIERSVR